MKYFAMFPFWVVLIYNLAKNPNKVSLCHSIAFVIMETSSSCPLVINDAVTLDLKLDTQKQPPEVFF